MDTQPLRTSVIGSYPFPGWLEFSSSHLDQFGTNDIAEMQDDAVIAAIHDQTTAGLDVITDGEQTRFDFNLSFYGFLEGIEMEPASPRRFGPPAHDQRGKHVISGELAAPNGLGAVEEFERLKRLAPAGPTLKASVPGPFTLSGRLLPNATYPDRYAITEALLPLVRKELEALVAAGCTEICVDEMHVEMANREFADIEVISMIAERMDVAVGIIDLKSYYIESADDIADRVRLSLKHAPADKPHTRMTARVIDPGLLTGLGVVTSSHNHTDHLDKDTLLPILSANPDIDLIIPEANRAFVAERLECDPARPRGMNDGDTLEAGGATFHGLPSAHDDLKTDDQGRHHFMGFIIEFGPWTIYHSGDTRPYDGLAERLGRFDIDLAFLPINGWAPERRIAGNLNAIEAVDLAKQTGIKMVVPHHYDMFTFNTADPADFAAEAARRNQPTTVLQNGERITLAK